MTSLAFVDIQIPATEIQIAEAIRVSDPDTADTIRRLAFQQDRLQTEIDRLTEALHEANRVKAEGCVTPVQGD